MVAIICIAIEHKLVQNKREPHQLQETAYTYFERRKDTGRQKSKKRYSEQRGKNTEKRNNINVHKYRAYMGLAGIRLDHRFSLCMCVGLSGLAASASSTRIHVLVLGHGRGTELSHRTAHGKRSVRVLDSTKGADGSPGGT